MSINITKYNCLCNLGDDIDEVFSNAIDGKSCAFEISTDIIKGKPVRLGKITCPLPEITNPDYNLRCNRLILKGLENLKVNTLISRYGEENIAIVVATTNSGVEEYETSHNSKHYEIGNPAQFVHEYYGLKNYYTSVSTACSSGIKAFSIAKELLESDFSKAALVIAVDSIAKVPVFGFNALEILSPDPCDPFAKTRAGINIGEGVAAFVLEKDAEGIEIAGIGETTDFYHATTPDPKGIEAANAINLALEGIPEPEVDYINLHGTGTLANDLMEGVAINNIFKDNVLVSSTKQLTGHCLGAAAGIEVCLCCKLLDSKATKVFPHIFSGDYDETIPRLKLATKENNHIDKIETCLCTSFGFSGTDTAILLRRKRDGKL